MSSLPAFAPKFAAALISPLGTALALWVVAGFAIAKWPRAARILAAVAMIWLWVWSLPAVSNSLRQHMESAYPPVPPSATPAGPAAVVLGGAVQPLQGSQERPNLSAAADRIWHAARLYHAGKTPLLVLSGGGAADGAGRAEAHAMRLLLLDLGVPEGAMLLEERSRSTAENARFSAELLGARGVHTVLLVTSALHMPRARRHFEAQGLRVLPAPTDHEARDDLGLPPWQQLLPDADALHGSARAMKEWLGQRWP